jgi:hypothetical protein
MRKAHCLVLCVLLAGGAAFAQGAGGGTKKTIAEQLRDSGTAGPGYIQEEFLGGLKGGLKEQFGEERSNEMWEKFQGEDLDEKEILGLMNGETTKSGLQDMFGAERGELGGLLDAIKEMVGEKEKSIFFGIVIIVMIVDFDVDPSSDFFKQVVNSKDEMSDKDFGKLKKGNVSKNTCGEAFGFDNKDDQKFMQQIMNGANQSPFMSHPMGQSMGDDKMKKGEFDASKFPELQEGMPGFGEDFADGMAGGFPFDQEMPPCPFMGGNMQAIFIVIGIIIVDDGGAGTGLPGGPGEAGAEDKTPKEGKDAPKDPAKPEGGDDSGEGD